MYCTQCGQQVGPNDLFCGNCGASRSVGPSDPMAQRTSPPQHAQSTEPPSAQVGSGDAQVKNAWKRLLDWRLTEQEAEEQIGSYATLSWSESYRKLAAGLILLTLVATAALASLMKLEIGEVIAEWLIWSPILLFAYRGHRWAFIVAMILWTFEKGYLLLLPPFGRVSIWTVFSQFAWWAVYMQVFRKAFVVEQLRRRLRRQELAAQGTHAIG